MVDLLKSKRLREERAPIAKAIQDLADRAIENGGEFPSEEDRAAYEAANEDYDAHTRSIELCERAERVSLDQEEPEGDDEQELRSGGNPPPKRTPLPGRQNTAPPDDDDDEHRDAGPTDEDHATALQGWLLAQMDKPITQRHKDAASKCGVRPYARHFDVSFRHDYSRFRAEQRALGTQTLVAGGATIPEGFVNRLELAMLQFGGMRQVADVMRTGEGNNIPWPTTNDTSNEGAIIGENTAVGNQDVDFGQVVFHAYKYTSKMVQVPIELLEDSAINVAAILGQMLGERIARITNRHFTVGTGASQPFGIVTQAATGKTAASATAIAADEILDLIHSVDPAYRNGAGFMFHDNTLLAIRKLKDGEGRYLWQSSLQVGEPDRLHGHPIAINQHMPQIATGVKAMLFGMFSKYKIRDVAGFRLRRLTERYADSDQEGFVAFSRHDGNLLDAGTNPVKALVMG